MKTTILGIAFLQFFLLTHLSAQEFAPVGATWIFPESYWIIPVPGIVIYTSTGDTTIQNKPARIINKDHNTCYGGGGDYYFHQSNDSIFRYDPYVEEFELAFIFNASVGDRWTIYEPIQWGTHDSMQCIVDSISYIEISPTDSLRVQHVRLQPFEFYIIDGDTVFFHQKDIIIERIGFRTAISAVEWWTICDGNFEGEIRCYEDEEVGLINFSDVDCFYVSTEEPEKTLPVHVYPNPASSHLYFDAKGHQISYVEIIDNKGRRVKVIEAGFEQIDISELPSGVYFVKIVVDGEMWSEMVVIQR